jgi:uncharacterized alkaline shock family protein YloU
MTMKKNTNLGDINVTIDAIASLTGAAVSECYGVVGMASKQFFRDGIAVLLKQDNYSRGIVVRQTDKGIELDIYLIICYGVKVIEVVSEVQKKVKYELENALDVEFSAVNVYVQDIKVID